MGRRIPCAAASCDHDANPANRRVVRTAIMPAPAFYYYCDAHWPMQQIALLHRPYRALLCDAQRRTLTQAEAIDTYAAVHLLACAMTRVSRAAGK